MTSERTGKLKRNLIATCILMIAAIFFELNVSDFDFNGATIKGLTKEWIVLILYLVGMYHSWMLMLSIRDDFVSYAEEIWREYEQPSTEAHLRNRKKRADDTAKLLLPNLLNETKVDWDNFFSASFGLAFYKQKTDHYQKPRFRRFFVQDLFVPAGILFATNIVFWVFISGHLWSVARRYVAGFY